MIGIITLNQDTFTNPTLFSIIEDANKKNIEVTLFCAYQETKIPKELKLTSYIEAPKSLSLPRHPKNILNYVKIFFRMVYHIKKNNICDLIAVDPSGLILSGRIKFFIPKIKIHYCSFEIFFSKEMKEDAKLLKLKNKEIKYTKKVSSIIIQDAVRQQLIIEENKIDSTFKNWHLIPVSPKRNETYIYKKYNKCDFGLKEDDVVYVHSGSIAEWAGLKSIIQAIEAGLPKNTYILVHNKGKFDPENEIHQKLLDLKDKDVNLILNDHVFNNYNEYCSFMRCFDYGIVIYKPQEGIYTGMNIREIGLSSGKFSTYMSVGLPSILFDCKIYHNLLKTYKIGAIEIGNKRLIDHINDHTLSKIDKKECIRLYEEVLDPSKGISRYIEQFDTKP